METRICTKCLRNFPATKEYFYATKRNKIGLAPVCKECRKPTPEEAEKARIRARQWCKNNPERRIQNKKIYYYSHHEDILEKGRIRYRAKIEEIKAYSRRWKKEYMKTEHGKALHRLHEHKRRAKKMNSGGDYNLDDIQNLYTQQNGLCWWCSCELNGKFHIDHRVPISRGGTNDLSNIVLACPPCNLSKNDRFPHEWNGRLL